LRAPAARWNKLTSDDRAALDFALSRCNWPGTLLRHELHLLMTQTVDAWAGLQTVEIVKNISSLFLRRLRF
jgi:hypothetical protein